VGDDPQRQAPRAGLADPVQLEERGSRYQPIAAQPDQQRGVALVQHQPGGLGDLGELAGQVHQALAMPVGPSRQHHQPTRAQQRLAPGQDPTEGLQQRRLVDPAEVAGIWGVGVVVLGDPLAGTGGDLPVDARTVGRGGQHQCDPSGQLGVQESGELAGVAGHDRGGPLRSVGAGMGGVGAGQLGPARLEFHADGVAAEVHGLD
jgi:hypothetical protein